MTVRVIVDRNIEIGSSKNFIIKKNKTGIIAKIIFQ